MTSKWMTVYDLSEDNDRISKVQYATLYRDGFGLVPEVALYGSPEWWKAIDNGLIQKHTIIGVISNLYYSGDSKWPLFEIDENGKRTVWTRFGDCELYETGKRVKLEYVVQRAKKSWTGDPYQNEVLSIDIETE